MAAIIPKIRAGNQFEYVWAIERAGVAVDLTTATDIELSYGVGKPCEDYSKIPFTVVDTNKISSSHLYGVTGTYNLKLEFKIDGEQSTIDIDAFKIVPRSEDASDSSQFAVTSDMAIGFKGDKGEKGDSSVLPDNLVTMEIVSSVMEGEIIVSAGGKEVTGSGKTMEELIASIPSGETLHSHANKDILDAIQESFTTSLKTAYNSAVTASHTHTVDFLQIVNTIPFVCSDETTDITASTTVPKKRFVFQTAQSFTKIVGELNVAAVGGTFTVDVKKNGTTTFSTLLTFNSGENTTRTASEPFVLATSPLVFGIGDYVEIFVIGIGSVTAGKGLTIYFM